MQTIENNVLFRFMSYLLCLLSIWGYGIFLYFSLFEQEFLIKSVIFSIVLTIGYAWSYFFRYSKQYFVKLILALLMIFVGIDFFRKLPETIYDPRIPLLELLISLLLLHSFDLPRRKDILYSITSSLIILVVLTVVSFSNFIVLYILIFTFLFYLTLFIMDSNIKDLRFLSVISLKVLGFVFFVVIFLFLILPKPTGGYFFRFVFAPKGEAINMSNPASNINYQKKIEDVFKQSYTYRGFKGEMNLENRGLLPHVLVMKVKMPTITYIKGIHLVKYDGKKWYNDNEQEINISSSEYSYFSSLPSEFSYSNYTVFNSYFMITADLPDILYHVPVPSEVFFPSSFLRMKGYNFYSEYPLVKGITYTVISIIPYVDVSKLKSISYVEYDEFFQKLVKQNPDLRNYIELPSISNKVSDLAFDITSGENTFWGKVEKIKNYLETNYTYDLFIDPPKNESVYDFLFIQKRGYCEQFASSLAVMLRILGIPCRVVLGYLPQNKELFTGFIEVYADDAHAWVEVLTPYGWIPVDPSPFNIDQQTLKYLENKSKSSNLFQMLGLDEEFIGRIKFLADLVFKIIVIIIASFLSYRIFYILRKNYLAQYLEKLELGKIKTKQMKKIFAMFIDYFRMKDIVFAKELTLREIKLLNIEDKIFQKFREFLDLYERYLYGPKL